MRTRHSFQPKGHKSDLFIDNLLENKVCCSKYLLSLKFPRLIHGIPGPAALLSKILFHIQLAPVTSYFEIICYHKGISSLKSSDALLFINYKFQFRSDSL